MPKPWNDTLCNFDSKAFPKNWTYRFWMSVYSRLNSKSIIPILDGSAELRYSLVCSECNHKIMKKSFADLNEIISYTCHVVDLQYGTFGTIHAGKRYILDPELHDCMKETFSIEELGVSACRGPNLNEIEYFKNGKKALELINAYKFDKMTQSESGKSCSNWIEAFVQNLSKPSLLMKLEDWIKMLIKQALNQAKPFIQECEKFSTSLLHNFIQNTKT